MGLTLEEIQKKISEVIEIWKPYRDDMFVSKPKDKYPEYYPGYRELVEDYEHIKYHAVKGTFPEELFKHRSPNQDAKEWEYQKNNYKQVTMPVYLDFFNVISRSWNDGNWSIEYPNEDKNEFKDYVSDIPKYGSLQNFVKSILTDVKLKDANGLLCVMPAYVPRDEKGNFLNGEFLDPIPVYYRTPQIVGYKENDYYIVELDEKSEVEYANQRRKKGQIYLVFDDENIWRVEQVGKFVDFTFNVSVYFNHNLGEVPARRLKGVPIVHGDTVKFQSPFLYAVDSLDLVALNASNLQLSINNCVYPYRIMIGNVCDFEDENGARCNDGWLLNNSTNERRICPQCNGSGLKSRLSPMGTLLIKPPSDDEPVSETGITTPMQFVSPSTETLSFLREEVNEHMNRAMSILHIKESSRVTGGEAETATGRAIDQKQQFTFIKPISDQLFDLYGFCLDAIGEMRFGSDYDNMRPSLKPSVSFDFLTQEDYLQQIKDAIDSGLPPFVLYPLYYKYLGSIFHTDNETEESFKLIIKTDRLLTLSSDDIAAKLSMGTAAKWEEVLHDSSVQLIIELLQENKNFFDQDEATQKQQLQDKAKEKVAEIDESRGTVDTQDIVDGVLGAEAPTDLEAEAKAKLKGTVGGVEGIININKAVGLGEMSEASAELLLVEIYGFDTATAKRLIEPTGNNPILVEQIAKAQAATVTGVGN